MQISKQLSRISHGLLPLAELAARLYVAKVFGLAGYSKTRDWDMTLSMFAEEYRVPFLSDGIADSTSTAIAASLATGIELMGTTLLVLGLWRKSAASILFAFNIAAVVSYYHVINEMPVALNDHLEWGLLLALLSCLPTQVLSLDALWQKFKPKRDQV
ncbi:DoxX family protein [Undibacterium cyanobacteriorum]|uniref:DoxX family protein n=1 Tax=Undibacterium cyanobacteriorum TaxID=3073561 RepID=A0ABY9RJ57_9BURK|nr:DoxX family protein [Undibacterium sp. 20NA77.5]WMW80869.1 DoxX family protein [Undibacterium sp. 20NA77.5]